MPFFVMVYGIRRTPRLRISATTTLAYLCGVARNEWRWGRGAVRGRPMGKPGASDALSSTSSASHSFASKTLHPRPIQIPHARRCPPSVLAATNFASTVDNRRGQSVIGWIPDAAVILEVVSKKSRTTPDAVLRRAIGGWRRTTEQ